MATAAASSPSAGERSLNLSLRVIRFGPALILVLLIAIMTLASPFFMTGDNLSNIAVQVAPLACLAIGQLFVVLVGGIDLSVGSVLALCTVTGALAYGWDFGGPLVIPMMLLTGAAVGALNGIMLVKGRMPHAFIPTLATLNAARGLALMLSDGAPMPGMPGIVQTAGGGELGPIPVPIIIVAVFGLLAYVLLAKLQWGRWIYLVGADKEAARRLGIPVDRVIISVFIFSGLAAGLAGVITAGRTNAGYPSAGQLDELAAISAVIIGGASFFGGRGTVGGAIVGVLIFGVINNGLNLLNVSTYVQLIAIGVIVVVAVELDVFRRRLEERFRTIRGQDE
ncbi:ABC transporter permease [Solirubrobacter sp. CPCC 204708]|uniref:ABC transporter permease n=1 Tax=Solirubrobacter deserti TaxID=2282478 RepID=A0ABT4RLK9_9ACTN|nr:ABC transporter permease [Solirubrobacter deserti]MBE2318957.1 ABC transporter permease [Solirubrobacter deserti]MDA0139318.1 ABC transporter permease [Solirubrobacter deserti]